MIKRLKPLVPILIDAMQRHGHLKLDPLVQERLLQVSAATIDRALSPARAGADGHRRHRTVVNVIRRQVPVRTFSDWRDPPPGFFEVDMVEHCGGMKTAGDFVHTLTLTDIASGWTECIAMPLRDQSIVVQAITAARHDLPFAMRGVDTDNDSAFMNQTVFDYCKANGLELTRSAAQSGRTSGLSFEVNPSRKTCEAAGAGRFAPGRPWTYGRCAFGAPGADRGQRGAARQALPTAGTLRPHAHSLRPREIENPNQRQPGGGNIPS